MCVISAEHVATQMQIQKVPFKASSGQTANEHVTQEPYPDALVGIELN